MDDTGRPGSALPRHATRARTALATLVGVLAVLALGPVATSGAATDPEDFVLRGTVLDERGDPAPRVEVSLTLPGGSSHSSRGFGAQTDAEGRYAFPAMPRPVERLDDVSLRTWESGGYALTPDVVGFPTMLENLRGPELRVDLRVKRLTATLRGRVSVRGRTDPGVAWLSVVPVHGGKNDTTTYPAWVDDDGRWQQRVPAGAYRVQASSRYGLGGWAPDLPAVREDSPAVTVAEGDVRDGVDVSLRERQAEPAYDEYGRLQDGFLHGAYDPGVVPGRYPVDPYRSVTSVVGQRLEAVAVRDGREAREGVAIVRVTNTGDDTALLEPLRFSGGDPFTCFVYNPFPCDSEYVRTETYVLPGRSKDLFVAPSPLTGRATYATTAIVSTVRPGPTLRVPVEVHPDQPPKSRPAPTPEQQWFELFAQAAATMPTASPGAAATAARVPVVRPGSRGDVGRIVVSRARLRVTFPAAGSATVLVDRSVRRRTPAGKVARRWATVRRIAVRAGSASTRTTRLKRLARGRYRVRTTYAIGARAPRATTTYWTLRR